MNMLGRIKTLALGMAALLTISPQANAATLIDATSIVISSAVPGGGEWLQVGEVQALNGFGVNVAASAEGGTASALSSYPGGYDPQKAIDGLTGGGDSSLYHSGSTSSSEYLQISFASPQQLASLTIFGRTNNGTAAIRDIYNVSVFGSGGAQLWSGILDARGPGGAVATSATIDFANMGAVPEPATWAMMLIGLGGVGFSMRRARRAKPRPC